MPALAIRQDLPATELRRRARHEPDRRAAMRLLAIASALEGMSRAGAARLAGMVPAGHVARIHLTLTDDHPWAQAFVIIEAVPDQQAGAE